MSPDEATFTDPETPPRKQGLGVCGCLLIVGVALLVLAIVGILVVRGLLNTYLPHEPASFEPVQYSTDEEKSAAETARALGAGESVEISPRELTILVQSQVFDDVQNDTPGKFRCDLTPDGDLDLAMSFRIKEDVPIFGGRYVNLETTGSLTIENSDVKHVRVRRYRLGAAEAEEVTEEKSRELFEDFFVKSHNPDVEKLRRKLELFKVENGKIHIRLKK